MAREIGPFSIWNSDLEKNNEFLLRLKKDDPTLYNDMQKYGRRNISLLTTAPAGTVSNLTQTSSGIEPVFQLSYIRRKKINSNDKDKIEEYKKKIQEMVNSGKDPRKNPHYDVYQPYQPLEEEPHHHVPTEEERLEYEAWLAEEERNLAEYMAMSDEDRRRMAQQQIEELMR
jgi:ribonucleotide reductase alpha subunit